MESDLTSLVFHNSNIRIGFHIGKERTLLKSFERMIDTPLRSYQIYVSNSRAYKPALPDPTDLRQTKHFLERNGKYACVHGSLLYNLAGSKDFRDDPKFQSKLDKTCAGLQTELDMAAGFGGGVVCHIGSCKYKDKGIFTIAKTIETILEGHTQSTKSLARDLGTPLDEFKRSRKLILENAAGEGTKLGSNLDEIAEIIETIKPDVRDQVKVCIDTAHIFGAGHYDLGSPDEVDSFFSDFDEKIGLDRLELFHLNDSRVPYGSHKDRHENLGMGYIFGTERDEERCGDGFLGLKRLISHAEERRIPLIGEPPAKTKEGYIGPGGVWDYEVIKRICNLEEEYFVCDS
jgi:deoxyribonuclease IV